jgi:hypothetical protein
LAQSGQGYKRQDKSDEFGAHGVSLLCSWLCALEIEETVAPDLRAEKQ